MEKTAEILERAAVLLEKYRKNKTLISPKDLAGKYKAPFEKLKQELKEGLEMYLKSYSIEGLILTEDETGSLEEFVEAVNRIFISTNMGKRVGKAAFKNFDLDQVKQLAEELRAKIYREAWVPYFQKHTCLYLTEECFAEDNPQQPRIYNFLVDKFWNKESGEWKSEEPAEAPALLICINGGKQHEQK